MLWTEYDVASELAAQLGKTDLGVAEAFPHTVPGGSTGIGVTRRQLPDREGLVFRLSNGQEFFAEITRWGGPRP